MKDERKTKKQLVEELKRLRETLAEMEHRTPEVTRWWRSLVSNVPDVMMTVDRKGDLTFINRSFSDLEAGEVSGRNVAELVPPQRREYVMDAIRQVFDTAKAARPEQVSLTAPEADTILDLVHVTPIVSDGAVIGAILVTRDVTDSRKAEEALAASEREKQLILDSSPTLIAYQNLDHEVIWANRLAAESVGKTAEELVGKKCYRIWAGREDPCPGCPVEKSWNTGRSTTGEIETPDGRTWLVSGSPIMDDGRITGAVETTINITDRVQAEHARSLLESELRQAQKLESIGRLAGGIAHDLNNLLSPIIGYSEMLLEGQETGYSSNKPIREIHEAGIRARSLVRQLLAFSRKQKLELDTVDLNGLVADFEKLLRRTIRENIEIDMNLSPLVRPVRADASQIEQVIMNLVVNAQDAMPQGGKLLIETDVVALDEDYTRSHQGVSPGEYVMLAISDTGMGMDVETRDRAFEPFYTTKTKDQGTGLGLSTAYGIVKQHGGSIWIYSEPGRGTTCKVYLPVTRDEITEAEKRTEPLRDLQGSETILLAEDNDQVRDLAREILELQGYRVLVAENGQQALSEIERAKDPIHLLLSDLVMPDMHGQELYTKLADKLPGLRVLFMSGYTRDAVAQHGITESEHPFLQKPFTVQDLLSKVREILNQGS